MPHESGKSRQRMIYPARVLTVTPSAVSEPLMAELEWHSGSIRPAHIRGGHKPPSGRFIRSAMNVALSHRAAKENFDIVKQVVRHIAITVAVV